MFFRPATRSISWPAFERVNANPPLLSMLMDAFTGSLNTEPDTPFTNFSVLALSKPYVTSKEAPTCLPDIR